MAHIATDNTDTTPRQCMDRLTHALLKETSRSLKYYMDVKRRENAFVLSRNSSVCDITPLKRRLIDGTIKEHPSSLHSSSYTDKNMTNLEQKQRSPKTTSSGPDKQMCRDELNFHMRSLNFSSKEHGRFPELRLRPKSRSNSLRTTHHEHDQLIDNTADILAKMMKSRRSFYQTSLSSQRTSPLHLSRISNHSSCQTETTYPTYDLRNLLGKKEKSRGNDSLPRGTSIMQKSKPITKGSLCDYKISITTGNCNGASTNAPIRIKLYGTNGHTNFNDLGRSETYHVPFLKGHTDVFTLRTYHVGELIGVTIGHNRKDMRASWFLSHISIEDSVQNITYDLPCNAWLSVKSNDQKTMRNFQVVSVLSEKRKSSVNEHQEENRSQTEYSTVSTADTITSNVSNLRKTTLSVNRKQMKEHQHVSSDSSILAEQSRLIHTNIDKRSQSSISTANATTIETHFNQDQLFSTTPASVRQVRSPILSTTDSDTEIEEDITNQAPTLNSTRLKSTNNDRSPARLEQRNSSFSISPEQSNKSREQE